MIVIQKNRSLQQRLCGVMLMLSLAASLSACGTKGALYLPEKKYPQAVPADATAPSSTTAPSQKTP
jgi:predicted small lipoprotein YifL